MIAIYPGTFDPITKGHINIIKRSLNVFDELIVAIAKNLQKKPLFSAGERLLMATESLKEEGLKEVKVELFDGLLVDFVKRHNSKIVIRGLRAVSDFEFELQMAFMNRELDNSIEMMFLMPSIKYSFLSSSIVKNVFLNDGCIKNMVPKIVAESIKEKLKIIKGERK